MTSTIVKSSNVQDNENLLRAKLLCTLQDNRLDVVYKLSVEEPTGRSEVPHHYIFVVDVSGSMNFKVNDKGPTKLDRVKGFAELLVKNINLNDFLSIVAFNVNATACLKKIKMSDEGKALAFKAIENMKAERGTNLQKGLQKGLEIANCFDEPTRDLIMLFTDGEATYGEKDPNNLVAEYKRLMAVPKRNHRIPLSAMSIGDDKPKLLCEISRRLGSDAFYWLNENTDFEADMFTPVFLRDSTQITDIATTLSCTHEDVTFAKNTFTTEYLEEKKFRQMANEEPTEPQTSWFDPFKSIGAFVGGLMSSNPIDEKSEPEIGDVVQLRYFVHGLPNLMSKNIRFALILPEDFKTKLNEKVILKVKTTYLDPKQEVRSLENDLVVYLKKMHETLLHDGPTGEIALYNRKKDHVPGEKVPEKEAQDIFRETVAYTMENNQVGKTWENAKQAYTVVALQQCRVSTKLAFFTMSQNLENNSFDQKKLIASAKKVCDSLSETISLLFGENDQYTEEAKKEFDAFKNQIIALERLLPGDNKSIWIKLISVEISLGKEMPTTSSVLEPDDKTPQLFMPEGVGNQLAKMKEEVKSKPYRGYKYGYDTTS